MEGIEAYLSNDWSFFLFPVSPSMMAYGNDILGSEHFYNRSKFLGVDSEGHIISKIKPGKRIAFEFLRGYEGPVWITIILFSFLIPFAMALINKTFEGFFANL